MDGGGNFGDGLEALVENFGPAVMVVEVPAAAVEALAQHAAMEAWVFLPLQMMLVWRYWHWRPCHRYTEQVAALHGGIGADDRMTHMQQRWRYLPLTMAGNARPVIGKNTLILKNLLVVVLILLFAIGF